MKRVSRFQKYECRKGHVSELLVEDPDRFKTQKCKKCGKKAEHVNVRAVINALPKSTIVYEKPVDGKMKRMYVDPQEPASLAYAEKQGFQRREIQDIAAMRSFEREVTREMKDDFAREQRGEHQRSQEFNERYSADLRAIISRSDLDPFTREILKEAANDTSGYRHREYDPSFRNPAYSE